MTSDANYVALEFIKSKHNAINEVCYPLFKFLHIAAFAYIKIFPDGRYIGFNSELHWCQYYFQNVKQNRIYMTEPIDNKLVVNKWPSLSDINSPHNIFKEYYTRGFANGIDICRVNNEILEAWTFIGTVNDTKLMNMHLQNCHILKQFISFFDTKFQAIIGNQSHIPFANFKNGAIIRPENDINIVNDTNKFLRYLEQCNREICIRNNIIRFTKREFESLEHLAKGESVKEIAKNLNLSPRTIEEYINKIKYKTGYILKSDLIKLFQDKFY